MLVLQRETGLEVFAPRIRFRRMRAGQPLWTTEALFPGFCLRASTTSSGAGQHQGDLIFLSWFRVKEWISGSRDFSLAKVVVSEVLFGVFLNLLACFLTNRGAPQAIWITHHTNYDRIID